MGPGMSFFYGFAAAIAVALVAFRVRDAAAEPFQSNIPSKRQVLLRRARKNEDVEPCQVDPALAASAVLLRQNGKFGVTKRMLDILLSIGLLVVTAPLLAITALAIKLESRGPVFYKQTRVGQGGRLFEILKFRSMVSDAEKDGAQFAAKNDARVTRVGRFIRKVRIDEIPQAINVLRGEMSFVGPRPERPEFVTDLEQELTNYSSRLLVKPGITGWAQVKYEYTADLEGARKKLRYDLFYVLNQSIWLDLAIIFLTIRVALFGLGSR